MAKKHLRVRSVYEFAKVLGRRFVEMKQKLHEIKKNKRQAFAQAKVPTKSSQQNTIVDISVSSVAKSTAIVFLMILLFFFLYQISGILLLFFISFLLTAALDPLIDYLQALGLPRSVGVLFVYLVIFIFGGMFMTKVVFLIADQIGGIAGSVGQFVSNLTQGRIDQFPFGTQLRPYLEQFYRTVDLQTAAGQIQAALNILSTQLVSISIGFLNLILILILTFFMSVEEKSIQQFFLPLFPSRYALYISTRLDAVKEQIGQWMRGQFLFSVIMAVLTYIGLVIMKVNYALTLSIIAGVCLVIPAVGRVFAWVLTFPIVYNQSPILSLWMSLYYFILQQIENNIIGPYIMNKVIGLSPIIMIFAMMVGGQYLGILGLIIAIPLATTVAIFVKDYADRAK